MLYCGVFVGASPQEQEDYADIQTNDHSLRNIWFTQNQYWMDPLYKALAHEFERIISNETSLQGIWQVYAVVVPTREQIIKNIIQGGAYTYNETTNMFYYAYPPQPVSNEPFVIPQEYISDDVILNKVQYYQTQFITYAKLKRGLGVVVTGSSISIPGLPWDGYNYLTSFKVGWGGF